MQTKLTLRLDDALIAQAKTWAKEHDVSLSEAVGGFFAQLPRDKAPLQLSSWTRLLVGAASSAAVSATDKAMREEYRTHVERKHA